VNPPTLWFYFDGNSLINSEEHAARQMMVGPYREERGWEVGLSFELVAIELERFSSIKMNL
jgi:hypothetical protein